jgi:hypothetical protein
MEVNELRTLLSNHLASGDLEEFRKLLAPVLRDATASSEVEAFAVSVDCEFAKFCLGRMDKVALLLNLSQLAEDNTAHLLFGNTLVVGPTSQQFSGYSGTSSTLQHAAAAAVSLGPLRILHEVALA